MPFGKLCYQQSWHTALDEVNKVLGFIPAGVAWDLIRVLQDYNTRPESAVRWRRGNLAIWDNRAAQHYAIGLRHRAPSRRARHRGWAGARRGWTAA